PAPFSPTRPTTSPRLTARSTLSSARTPANRLLIERSSSNGNWSRISYGRRRELLRAGRCLLLKLCQQIEPVGDLILDLVDVVASNHVRIDVDDLIGRQIKRLSSTSLS